MKRRDILENQVNRAYLSIGSNLGKKIYNLEKTKYLLDLYGINILKVSSLYQTKSWPNKSFPDYINTVFLVKTYLNLTDLFKKLKFIEKIMGRIDAPKNFPRICDIDIIDYNGKWRNISYLGHKIEVPHAKMHQRNFVLVPLYEINRNWIHPKFKKNIVKLISSLSTKDLRTIKLS